LKRCLYVIVLLSSLGAAEEDHIGSVVIFGMAQHKIIVGADSKEVIPVRGGPSPFVTKPLRKSPLIPKFDRRCDAALSVYLQPVKESREEGKKMLFLKLSFVVFATVCVLVLFTCVWVAARTPGPWFVGKNQGATGVDVNLVSAMTLHSPLYWLLAAAILAAAGWLCRRWVFPA
jgi:hypothetical protein